MLRPLTTVQAEKMLCKIFPFHLDALHVQVAVVRCPLLVLLTRVLVVLVLAGSL